MNFVIRPLMVEDESIVWEMLRYAAHESSIEIIDANFSHSEDRVSSGKPECSGE